MAKKEFIKAGELDTPIDIYTISKSQNDYGEIINSLSFHKTVFAKLITTGTKGNEKVEDSTIRALSKINFLERNDPSTLGGIDDGNSFSVESSFKIKYKSKYWDIVSYEYLGRGQGAIIRCEFTDNNLG